MNKGQIFAVCILSLTALGGFIVSTNYSDMPEIVDGYKSTTDGSYFRKHLTASEELAEEDKTQKTTAQADIPTDLDVDSWIAYITACDMSDTRRKIVLEGLNTVKRGCVYHQIRNPNERPNKCPNGSCDGQIYAGAPTYDFYTQSNYNAVEPLYLDCSFFIKHCYWAAGLDMLATNTSTIGSAKDMITIPLDELVPGDVVNRAGTHVRLYIGKNVNGELCWAEMSNHKNDAILSTGNPGAGYVPRRYGTLANDTKFSGVSNNQTPTVDTTKAGTYQLSWDANWSFAQPDMVHPATINKYVPDNYNGKTVFLNAGHGNGQNLASTTPNDPVGNISNQYGATSSRGHTSGTSYITSTGKKVKEAEYVLAVSELAKDKLLAKGYAVVMARESMVNNFENAARSVWANNVADIHVAIHINAGTDGPSWYEASTTQQKQANCATWYAEGKKLGQAIELACSTSLGKTKRNSLSGNLTGYCYSTIPCTYIELFGVESKAMADFADSHKEQAAEGIVNGIDAYFK